TGSLTTRLPTVEARNGPQDGSKAKAGQEAANASVSQRGVAGNPIRKERQAPGKGPGDNESGPAMRQHPGPWQFLPKKGTAMSLLANRQPKAKVKPASGRCRWVLPIGEVGTGVLAINGHNYTVAVLRGPSGIRGYRLVKIDGTAYDVGTTDGRWTCGCPD